MMYRILAFVILSSFYFTGFSQEYLKNNAFDFGKIVSPEKLTIPNPTEVLDRYFLAKTLHVEPNALSIKDSKSLGKSQNSKSTFFKIIEGDVVYAGLLLQISTNPVYDEAPAYITNALRNKIEQGEVLQSTNKRSLYSEDYAGKIRFVYNTELGNIYWNIGDNYLLMIKFNGIMERDEEITKAAKALIPHISNNLLAKLLE